MAKSIKRVSVDIYTHSDYTVKTLMSFLSPITGPISFLGDGTWSTVTTTGFVPEHQDGKIKRLGAEVEKVDLNKAVVEVKPQQDGPHVRVGEDGIPNHRAHNGLGGRTALPVEPDAELACELFVLSSCP